MVNKKGFIRTLEAVVAIILIFSFIFFILPKRAEVENRIPENVQSSQQFILNEILYNSTFRDCIFNYNLQDQAGTNCQAISETNPSCDINLFIRKELPFNYDFACEVCNQVATCIGEDVPFDKSVYANSIFLVKDPLANSPKVLRVYVWQKEI
ncbi:MAG TPA: hypothetical protein VJB94_01935 [Candidatus Nanoarchaeia archaeon]|nr:hypothetical protein [Candidatus Nanoarchaeia archaeon]